MRTDFLFSVCNHEIPLSLGLNFRVAGKNINNLLMGSCSELNFEHFSSLKQVVNLSSWSVVSSASLSHHLARFWQGKCCSSSNKLYLGLIFHKVS